MTWYFFDPEGKMNRVAGVGWSVAALSSANAVAAGIGMIALNPSTGAREISDGTNWIPMGVGTYTEVARPGLTPEISATLNHTAIFGTTNARGISHLLMAVNAATDAAASTAFVDGGPNVYMLPPGLCNFPIPSTDAVTTVHVVGIGSATFTADGLVIGNGTGTAANYLAAQTRFDIDGAENAYLLRVSTSPATDFANNVEAIARNAHQIMFHLNGDSFA